MNLARRQHETSMSISVSSQENTGSSQNVQTLSPSGAEIDQ